MGTILNTRSLTFHPTEATQEWCSHRLSRIQQHGTQTAPPSGCEHGGSQQGQLGLFLALCLPPTRPSPRGSGELSCAASHALSRPRIGRRPLPPRGLAAHCGDLSSCPSGSRLPEGGEDWEQRGEGSRAGTLSLFPQNGMGPESGGTGRCHCRVGTGLQGGHYTARVSWPLLPDKLTALLVSLCA